MSTPQREHVNDATVRRDLDSILRDVTELPSLLEPQTVEGPPNTPLRPETVLRKAKVQIPVAKGRDTFYGLVDRSMSKERPALRIQVTKSISSDAQENIVRKQIEITQTFLKNSKV